MTKTLEVKQGTQVWNGSEWVDGKCELYRFVDTDNERDLRNATWRSTVEAAERSWQGRHPA